VYAILLEGGIVGSSERGGNEDPVEGRAGGVEYQKSSIKKDSGDEDWTELDWTRSVT
jgi:hypothetical protein